MAQPAKPKPKFPNAKTYKDAKGNIREVGTGRLIRAAARPAGPKKPKTFKDGQGVIRTVGTGVAVNPLDRQVDAAILQQTAPLTSQIGQAGSQFAAEQSALNDANTALGTELAGIQNHISAMGAQQLGAAANAAGGTAAQQQGNLDYLQSILGTNISGDAAAGLGGTIAGLAAEAQGEGAGAVANLALGQRGQVGELGVMSGANAMQTGRLVSDRLLAKNAAIKTLQDKIAAAKANRSQVKNDLINQSLAQQAARQEIRLAQAEFDRAGEQQEFENDLAQQNADTAAANAGVGTDNEDGTVSFGGIRLPAGQAGLVRDGIGAWRAQPDAKRTLNSFLARVTQSSGLSRTMVARLAMNMLSTSEIKRYAGSKASFLKSMKEAGVNEAARTAWATKVWGGGSTTAKDGPVTPGMVLSSIKATPYPIKVGTTFRINDKNFTVQKIQRTIAGITYTMRGPTGREFVVTKPNPTS